MTENNQNAEPQTTETPSEAPQEMTDAQAAENLYPENTDDTTAGGEEAKTQEQDDPEKKTDSEDDKGDKPDEKEEGEGKDKEEGESQYTDFTIPDDLPAQETDVTFLKEFGSKHGLTQDALQELIDQHVSMTQRTFDEFNNMKTEWKEQLESDPKIGGENLKTTIEKANQAVALIGDDELIEDLTLLGVGNKRSFANAMLKVSDLAAERDHYKAELAKLTSEDSISDSLGAGQESKLPPEQVLYKGMS